MRRKCKYCGAVVEISGDKVDVQVPFESVLCGRCINWIAKNARGVGNEKKV